MSNENQNNFNSWKIKLDELNSLRGEPIADKNASWRKLDSRLHEKRTDRKPTWYWIAAACILFALVIPLIFFNKKEGGLSKIEIKQNQPEIKNPLISTIDKKDSIKNIFLRLSEKNIATVQKKNNKISNKIILKNQINKFHSADTDSIQNLMVETKINSLQPVGISIKINTVSQIKKKLKVVYINELGDPVKEPTEIANRQELHSFQLKFAGQETYSNPTLALDKTGFTIFKIKSSSN